MLAGPATAQAPARTMHMASGPAGTVQHIFATAVAKVVSDVTGSSLIVGPYGGTSSFLAVVANGEVGFGLATAVDYAMSYRGPGRFTVDGRNPYSHTPDLRLVAMGTNLVVGLLVPKESGIRTVQDLKGRRVAGEFPAHLGAFVNTYAQLLNGGLKWDDVRIVPVPGLTQGIEALSARRVEVTTIGVGAPQVRELDAKIGVRHVGNDCSPAAQKRVTDAVPGYFFVTLKPGTIPAIVEDTCLTAFPVGVAASLKTPDADVALVVKAIYENFEKLHPIHPGLRSWTQKSFVREDATMPYHSAAISYYKSINAWPAAMDQVQERLLAMAK
ncbi:MAG: TAXI family TRAP transporter solute-binding subunit [Alphaproteobacteria bacterium]|nr:TAXI family TRAP transporter solute-binding subunit [Alphaproteobacteria bacterium]